MKRWEIWILTIVGVIAIGAFGRISGRHAAELRNETAAEQSFQTPVQAKPPEVIVAVTSQDALGQTELVFDEDFLRNLENWTTERVVANTKKAMINNGLQPTEPNTQAQSGYVEMLNHKLAVVRVVSDNQVSMLRVTGIVGAELKSVGCTQESPESIPLTFGACGDRVKQVFGPPSN